MPYQQVGPYDINTNSLQSENPKHITKCALDQADASGLLRVSDF